MVNTIRPNETMPRALPTIRIEDAEYFVDLRVGEFRDINLPWQNIRFDSERGRQFCSKHFIVACPRCNRYNQAPKARPDSPIICVDCGKVFSFEEV